MYCYINLLIYISIFFVKFNSYNTIRFNINIIKLKK